MSKLMLAAAAAAALAACASQPERKVVVSAPPTVRTEPVVQAPPPAPVVMPQPTVVVPQPQVTKKVTTTTVQTDDTAAREAQARAAEAERQAADAEARASDAERRAQEEAQARQEAERRASDIEREIAAITEVQRTDRGLVVTLSGDVLFEFDRAALLPTAQDKLSRLAAALAKTDLKASIEGHTDAVGADAYNLQLSTRRAEAVRDQLVAHGVAAERLKVVGAGETRPIASNASSEGRAMNRRVEIIIETPPAQ